MMSTLRTTGDLCTREVVTASRATVLNEAARLMRDRHVGCIVVVDELPEGRIVVGLLTDRDIVTAVVAKDVEAMMLRVGEVMSEDVTTVNQNASLHDAIALMRRRRVRRMPVTDDGGFLVGLLASDDIVGLLTNELRSLAEVLTQQRRVEQVLRP
jgi:CBS domain-containing protein